MPRQIRIVASGSAFPPFEYTQAEMLARVCATLFGADWAADPARAEQARQVERLFVASQVRCRRSVVDASLYYARVPSTGERMAQYATYGREMGRAALDAAASSPGALAAASLSHLFVVSCTGYAAPGLDIVLARDLGMTPDVRRLCIGHMGCHGALVGLRAALATLRAEPDARVALLAVELATLHFMPTLDAEVLTSFALFGDAAAAVHLSAADGATGPELVDSSCETDYAAAGQMSWTIGDTGFVMGLSPRVPVTLRRRVSGAVERLLAPHGLAVSDVAHWLVHPGGPSILQAIQKKLELSDAQMALAWQTLREHGNCSSATVLVMLDALLRSGAAQPGTWGVMMAFGPGLTLELCLLRF